MSFQKYNVKDNAFSTLLVWISASATSLQVQSSAWDLFPWSNFIATLVQYETPWDETTAVVKREKVLVTNNATDTFTITRGFDWDTPVSFDAWDFIYLNVVSKIIEDIQDEATRLESDKLDSSWELRTWLTNWRLLLINWSWVETELALWSAWQVLISQWTTSNPIWQAPSVDINWLDEVTSITWTDDFLVRTDDWNRKITKENLEFNLWLLTSFWDWSDWDITITTAVTLTRDMYYNNLILNSPWVLNPNWYKIYVRWTLSWDWIIRRNWNNWWNWTTWWNPAWWAWWVALNQWSLNADIGWNRWWWWDWFWINWWVWVSSNPSYTQINWVAWWAWATRFSSWTGWAWWTSTRWTLYNIYNSYQSILSLLNPASFSAITTQYKWASWSWWGGADWIPNAWASWWWGWWNGWIIWVSAKIINFTWTMESKWWNGWNGWWDWSSATWWWGWWWQWWVVYLISSTFTSIWTQILTWWTWWLWYSWSYTSQPWVNWNSWVTIQITI